MVCLCVKYRLSYGQAGVTINIIYLFKINRSMVYDGCIPNKSMSRSLAGPLQLRFLIPYQDSGHD